MAWNALTGQFRKREDTDKEQEKSLFDSRPAGGGWSGSSPQAIPMAGFGGEGGSQGAPASASFVNYGTLFEANKDKAASMANNVYRGAEKKAEDARGKVAGAQQMFQDKVSANAGSWAPIKGKHGTEIIGPTQTQTQPTSTDKVTGQRGTGGRDVSGAIGLDVPIKSIDTGGGVSYGGTITDPAAASASASSQQASKNASASSRYRGLFGDMAAQTAPLMTPQEQQDARDYNHAVTYGQANTGSQQEYAGPDSLKDSMGDEEYAKLAEEIRKADEGIGGLSTAEGIAQGLGYSGVEGSGAAALDAGLAQTAGQASFKDLQRRYGNIGKTLSAAQSDSLADVGRADAASEVAASEWEDMLKQFEAEQAKSGEKHPGAITIDAAQSQGSDGDVLGQNEGTDSLATPGPGWDELESAGYSQQEIADLYDSLSDDEKAVLAMTKDQRATTSGLSGGTGSEIWQSIMKKLDDARAKKRGE